MPPRCTFLPYRAFFWAGNTFSKSIKTCVYAIFQALRSYLYGSIALGNRVNVNPFRGFESLSLRQIEGSLLGENTKSTRMSAFLYSCVLLAFFFFKWVVTVRKCGSALPHSATLPESLSLRQEQSRLNPRSNATAFSITFIKYIFVKGIAGIIFNFERNIK